MSNKAVFFIIWTFFVVLTAVLYFAADAHDQWRGFWVSTAQLLITALVLSRLLRS